MKFIYLRSSEIAKLTGHNKYDSEEKTINEILSRNKIAERYVPKSNVEEGLHGLNDSQLNTLKTELNMNQEATLHEIESKIKSNVMSKSYSGKITEEESKDKVDQNISGKDVLQTLETSIKKDLRMRRGNIKENSNLDVIQKKKNITVGQRNSQMYTKELHRTDKYTIVIRGKVDGVSDGIIVESKNRTSRLFNELRQYEQVQLESYMFLTDMKEALLIEHYNDTSNEIPYTHDNEFWSSCVESIIGFIDTHIAIHIQ